MSKQKYPQTSVSSNTGTTVKRPTKANGYSNTKLRARIAKRQSEADGRQLDYESLTVPERIELVHRRNKKLGGTAKRELARLTKLLPQSVQDAAGAVQAAIKKVKV